MRSRDQRGTEGRFLIHSDTPLTFGARKSYTDPIYTLTPFIFQSCKDGAWARLRLEAIEETPLKQARKTILFFIHLIGFAIS